MTKARQEKAAKSRLRILRDGDLCLDPNKRILLKAGAPVSLTPKECMLLYQLMLRPQRVVERKQLIKQVWETEYMGDTRTLDVHIHWLRDKVENDPHRPCRLRTVRGVGYCYQSLSEEEMRARLEQRRNGERKG